MGHRIYSDVTACIKYADSVGNALEDELGPQPQLTKDFAKLAKSHYLSSIGQITLIQGIIASIESEHGEISEEYKESVGQEVRELVGRFFDRGTEATLSQYKPSVGDCPCERCKEERGEQS